MITPIQDKISTVAANLAFLKGDETSDTESLEVEATTAAKVQSPVAKEIKSARKPKRRQTKLPNEFQHLAETPYLVYDRYCDERSGRDERQELDTSIPPKALP